MKNNNSYLYKETCRLYEEVPDLEEKRAPHLMHITDGVILPAVPDPLIPWGRGGVVDRNGNFIPSSAVDDAFGGIYPFNRNDVPFYNEEVLYLGIVPDHWGHMLIDVLPRLWPLTGGPQHIRIAYTGLAWSKGKGVSGNCLSLLRLAGIRPEDLLYIDRPTAFRSIAIPERTMGFSLKYNRACLSVIRTVTENAERIAAKRGCRKIDDIYFTRMYYPEAKKKEIGEEEIAALFARNGYTVIAPETLPPAEQIYLAHHCRNFVSISGTPAHNAIFSSPGTHLTILNRTALPNPPQLRINQLIHADCTYVDVFEKRELRHAAGYRGADNRIVHVLGINENLRRYATDRGFSLPDKSKGETRFKKECRYILLTALQQARQVKSALLNTRLKVRRHASPR